MGRPFVPAQYKWTCVVSRYVGPSPHRGRVHCGSLGSPCGIGTSLAYPDGRCALPAAPHRTRTAVRAVGSALGQAHWPPPQAGATSGRWPTVPGVTHLIACAQVGPIRSPGGAPNPRGRVPHQRLSRALVTPAPPRPLRRWSLPLAFVPRGVPLSRAPCRAPWPPPCPVCPCCLPLLWRVGVLCCLFVIFFFSVPCPPPCPLAVSSLSSPFPWVGGGVGGGGASLLTALLRKHVVSTAQARGAALVAPRGGGGGLLCGSRRHPTLLAVAPPVVPPLGPARRVLPLGTVVWFVPPSRSSASPPCRGVLGGGGPLPPTVFPHVPSPSPRCPRPFPWWVWELGVGRGGRPRCPSSGVSTSQARHWHVARHLSFCSGVGHTAWPPSSPFPLCVRSPGAPPAGACTALASLGHGRVVRPAPSPRRPPFLPLGPREGGPLSAPPFLHPPPLGGRRRVRGGGPCRFPFVALMSQARGAASVPLQGGGVCLVAPVVALSTLRPPSRWSPRRGLHGACSLRARSCGSSRYRRLPTLPRCPRGGGGGGRLPPPPYPHSLPSGGRGWVGGGGAPFSSPLHCTHVAGKT